jgi:hypothetical protein
LKACGHRHARRRLLAAVSFALFLSPCTPARAQAASHVAPGLARVASGSKVRLTYGRKSAVVDLEEEAPGLLPGDEPHRYVVLLTARKDKALYWLARVCSRSPVSDPNAPCGGDRPCALLWIKSDEGLGQREIKGEVYASCSYNYYAAGAPRVAGGRVTVVYREGFDRGDRFELSYDNRYPENGITLKKLD